MPLTLKTLLMGGSITFRVFYKCVGILFSYDKAFGGLS